MKLTKLRVGALLWMLWGALAQAQSLDEFARDYFARWQATQQPGATAKDLQHYLALLHDDVGHQHLPYDPDASRHGDGKQSMLQGMNYYLGLHTDYQARLLSVTTGHQVVIIKYHTDAKGKHPQSGEVMSLSYATVEVLEMENDKVAVIRKYSE